ncbi:hypothetical protein ACWC9T_06555 [Kitasatospora sp. NPDC001159]
MLSAIARRLAHPLPLLGVLCTVAAMWHFRLGRVGSARPALPAALGIPLALSIGSPSRCLQNVADNGVIHFPVSSSRGPGCICPRALICFSAYSVFVVGILISAQGYSAHADIDVHLGRLGRGPVMFPTAV